MNSIDPDESQVTKLSNCANHGLRISMMVDKNELMNNLKENLNDTIKLLKITVLSPN